MDTGHGTNKTDKISVRDGSVSLGDPIGDSETDPDNYQQRIHLGRSISEFQQPTRTKFVNTPNESPVEVRRHPGRVATMDPTTMSFTAVQYESNRFNSLPSQGRYNKRPKHQKNAKSMVLQLVLPLNGINKNINSENNSPVSYAEMISPNNPNRPNSSSIYSLQECPDLDTNDTVSNGFISNDRNLKQRRSPPTWSNLGSAYSNDSPTPLEAKKKAFASILTKASCLLYAIFIITLGFALHLTDISHENHVGSEIFSVILVVISFAYIIYLTIDIYLYKRRKQQFEKLLEEKQENGVKMQEIPNGLFQIDIDVPETMGKSIKHDYCFSKDRHSTNFFIKVGAVGFCFGHLIHSSLLLGYQIIFITSSDDKFYACASVPTLIVDLLYPIYSFFLIYFLFKYSNVIINKYVTLARFGIVHCLSASICFWIWTIIRETAEAVNHKKAKQLKDRYVPDDLDLFRSKYLQNFSQYANASLKRFTPACEYDNDESIKSIYGDISPYLYPFSVEFSILIVGIWYLIWQNIGICKADNEEEVVTTTQCNNPPSRDASDYTESNVVVYADCQASNKGLFGGIVVLVLTVVSCILYFICVYVRENMEQGALINTSMYLMLASIMFISCCIGYRQITKLDINTEHHNTLDDFLLFICLPAYFLNGTFTIIPAISNGNITVIIDVIIGVSQVVLQTIFILDGTRRCSNTRSLRRSKPGKEIVTFLIIANIAVWLLQTFQVKSSEVKDERYEYYGENMWTILGHICLPLMMFYRFHSSVCLGDIWKFAYEPSGH